MTMIQIVNHESHYFHVIFLNFISAGVRYKIYTIDHHRYVTIFILIQGNARKRLKKSSSECGPPRCIVVMRDQWIKRSR